MINGKTIVCCVIGNPVAHSFSPQIHNAGYSALGLDFIFTAFKVENIQKAITGFRSLGIRGISVTIPHKSSVMEYLDTIDPMAKKIGAVNTIVNTNGALTGYNTDYIGAIQALEEKTELKDKNVVLVGAGGAARGVAFGLQAKGANITILNRDKQKAILLAKAVGGKSGDLQDFSLLQKSDILIHATSAGMHPNTEESIVPKEYLHAKLLVMDIVFNPKETRLLQDAKKAGCEIIYGYKMLLYQAVKQFELYTQNKNVPVAIMEEALKKALKN